MDHFSLYILIVVGKISYATGMLLFVSLLSLVIFSVVYFVDDDHKEFLKHIKINIWASIVLLCATVIVPTQKEIAIIYVVPKIINSEAVKKDLPEIYDLGVNYIKEQLKKEEKK